MSALLLAAVLAAAAPQADASLPAEADRRVQAVMARVVEWRREMLRLWSSLLRSTSGRMPVTESKRPMRASFMNTGNTLPVEGDMK